MRIAGQEALWAKLGGALEQLRVAAAAVWHLQRVLAKKRDPLTHALVLDAVVPDPADPLPCDRVWCAAFNLIKPSHSTSCFPSSSSST